MALKNPLSLKRYLYVLVHAGTGTPYAFQLNLQKLTSIVVGTALVFTTTVVGSLMFFRELELNRKLQEQLLDVETRDRLVQVVPVAPAVAGSAAPARSVAVAPTAVTETAGDDIATIEVAQREGSSSTAGRVSELQVDCVRGQCSAKLSLMTNGTAAAEGQLLIVLEAEIPRIGSAAAPGTQMRKRYFVYPGDISREDLDPQALSQLGRKSFRFSRGLQTTAVFHVGKLLRPLAVNAYIYDKDHALVQHERRAIENEGDLDGME